MADVIAWPPFGLTGWELDEEHPQSRSVGLIGGRARTSSALRGRRVATAYVAGIGPDLVGAGYVRMLKRIWGGSPRLVRADCFSTLWRGGHNGIDLASDILEWTSSGDDLVWTSSGDDLIWTSGQYSLQGEPQTSGGWFSLRVTGLPPHTVVARPSEKVVVTNGGVSESAYALRTTISDAAGVAKIRTDRPTAFTISGIVSLGDRESIVFEALDMPRSIQPLSGDWSYQWNFREVFADEYQGGFTELDPWS